MAVGVAGLDKDDFLAGTGFECAGKVEFGVGGEDADGLLEACHLAPGHNGGRCVGFAREAHAPGQVADFAHQGQEVFAACSDEYGLRDEWLFDQEVAAAEFFAHGLYGVKEFGRGMEAGYYALLELVEAHAAAHAQHIPAGVSLCEQLFDFALGAWLACARGHGGGTRGQRVGGACGELCLGLGGCGAAAHGHGCPERAGQVGQADVDARRQVAEVTTEAFGEVDGYLTRCAVGLPQVEDVFAMRRGVAPQYLLRQAFAVADVGLGQKNEFLRGYAGVEHGVEQKVGTGSCRVAVGCYGPQRRQTAFVHRSLQQGGKLERGLAYQPCHLAGLRHGCLNARRAAAENAVEDVETLYHGGRRLSAPQRFHGIVVDVAACQSVGREIVA